MEKEAFKPLIYTERKVDREEYLTADALGNVYSLIGPNNVILQVNYACYLKCQMCNRHEWVQDGADVDEVLTTEEIVSLIEQLEKLKTNRITIVGTEPVMRKDLPQILREIRSRNIKPELYTAGIILKKNVIEEILNCSVDVAFSIDGLSAVSHNTIRMPNSKFDAFSKTLSSIASLKRRRKEMNLDKRSTRISANFTIQRINIGDLETATCDEIDALNVDVIRFSLVHGDGDYKLDKNDISTILAFARKMKTQKIKTQILFSDGIENLLLNKITEDDFDKGVLVDSNIVNGSIPVKCHIGDSSTMIDPKGNVRPCLYLYDDNGPLHDSDRDKYVVGNIKEKEFGEIWTDKPYLNFRDSNNFPDFDDSCRCNTCEYIGKFQELDTIIEDSDSDKSKDDVNVGW